MKGKKAATIAPSARATLTSLPEGVVEMIVSRLEGDDKAHLALCCKALLPVLGMGHVRVNLDKPASGRPLLKATRCLTKQPSGASHLEVFSWVGYCQEKWLGTRHLIDLSLLMNLRKLTLQNVAVFLPALQPVATRLHELHLPASCLQGRSDGFLTRGWTALTKLSLARASAEDTDLTQLLNLPALEDLNILNFRHQGGSLQLDQLTGSCPQIRKLMLQQDSVWGREGRGPCCSLLKLGRLADLYVQTGEELLHASLDLDLPASMTTFRVAGDEGGDDVDFFWALREVMKCIRRGAQLRKVTCYQADAYLQPAQWGASLDEQFRRLGGQLSTLQELAVWGGTEQLLIALVAVLSSAPNLTCVKFTLMEWLPCMELPPICSASLVSISVTVDGEPSDEPPPPRVTPLVLTFLPGCTQLQQVLVQITDEDLTEGTTVKIRCHSGSPTCVVPMDVHARAAEQMRVYGYASGFSEVGVQFLPGPSSAQGVQRAYTVLYACHAAGPQQPLTWGHVVVPGFL